MAAVPTAAMSGGTMSGGTMSGGTMSGGTMSVGTAAGSSALNAGAGAGASATGAADMPPGQPGLFRLAVETLTTTLVRPEVRISPLRAPQRLAPFSYALGLDVDAGEGPDYAAGTTGRLVLLHDPDGQAAWDGVLRLVGFVSAELDEQMALDPMMPSVGWSWLVGALDERGAGYRAAGGTVTQTTSSRFGDIAGPSTTVALELRASWTADSPELAAHLHAFVDLLCLAAGLPPEGVSSLLPA